MKLKIYCLAKLEIGVFIQVDVEFSDYFHLQKSFLAKVYRKSC